MVGNELGIYMDEHGCFLFYEELWNPYLSPSHRVSAHTSRVRFSPS